MTESVVEWGLYDAWNLALAAALYGPEFAGVPAYLDLEDDVLSEAAQSVAPGASDPQDELVRAVVRTFDFSLPKTRLFDPYVDRLAEWQTRNDSSAPPTVALLAMLSLVAENMHAGDGLAAHNFYARLGLLCGFTGEQLDQFQKSYYRERRGFATSEILWSSLNAWLDRLEGAWGVPTAYAVGHAHIGPPLSQALVRKADRENFEEMFNTYRLAPRSSLGVNDMARIINEWIWKEPCPASSTLRSLWAGEATARDRIAEVACQLLETWEGTHNAGSPTAPGGGVFAIKATATLRRFPTASVQISLMAPWRSEEMIEVFEVLDVDDTVLGRIEMVPVAPGWYGPASNAVLEMDSFLKGRLVLRHALSQRTLVREPRRLMPMRLDDLTRSFVETDRVLLGEDTLVICLEDFANQVSEFLSQTARPGWEQRFELPGAPAGWAVFTGVEVLTSATGEEFLGRRADLNLLQPIATSQLTLQGGLSLPGHVKKWSSGRPPEIRATTDAESGLLATVRCMRPLASPTPTDRRFESSLPALTWDLESEKLPDGDYEITVSREGANTPFRRETLRLRSADSPSPPLVSVVAPLNHDTSLPLWPLSAGESEGASRVRGAWVSPRTAESSFELVDNPMTPRWYGARKAPAEITTDPYAPIVIRQNLSGSCRLTGEHYWHIETAHPGRHPAMWLGTCSGCGMMRLFSNSRRRPPVRTKTTVTLAPVLDVGQVPAAHEAPAIDFGLCFDALCHVGGGSFSAFERVALQVEPTRLFSDVLLRTLESLGHIEVERSATSLTPSRWEIAPPTLAQLPNGNFVFMGFRSSRAMTLILDRVPNLGASVKVIDEINGPPVVRILNLSDDGAIELASNLIEILEREVEVALDASLRLASVLPPFSSVVRDLPITGATAGDGARWWDPSIARYKSVRDTSRAGAFQLGTFARRYIYRRPEDIGSGVARIGDARTVKFAAALDAGLPLAGYDESAEVLWTPLGAELPGLYGRAACLASGRPPRPNPAEGLLEYRDVPPSVGRQLVAKLMI
jgi:hypothetical protein